MVRRLLLVCGVKEDGGGIGGGGIGGCIGGGIMEPCLRWLAGWYGGNMGYYMMLADANQRKRIRNVPAVGSEEGYVSNEV
jgi:hypothetical protein